jgi:hypothetical protein
MLTDEQLTHLEGLLANATQGPWRTDVCDGRTYIDGPDGDTIGGMAGLDAAIVVEAINALPQLLAEIRQLRSERERVFTSDELFWVAFEGGVVSEDDFDSRKAAVAVARHVGARVSDE